VRRAVALLAACAAACVIPFGGPYESATILHGGRIHVLDTEGSVVEALALRGGRVIAAGTLAEAERAAGADAERVDLRGRTVYPGFADAHLHLTGIGLARMRADLTGTRSFDEVVARAVAHAATLPEGAWLQGRGWDQNDWSAQEFPTHHALSAALPERPVALTRVDGHALLANAAAMRAAGVSAATPDPPGGRILRDAAGAPTGVFVDAAEALILGAVPAASDAELERALALAQDALHEQGITAVHDAGVGERELALYERWAREGRLRLRVHAMLHGNDPQLLERHFARGPEPDFEGRGVLAVRAIKLYADGALGSRGALLLEDYADEPGHRGLPQISPSELAATCAVAFQQGFQVCTHAIGDGANRMVLDAYEYALGPIASWMSQPRKHARWRVEHAQVLHRDEVQRFVVNGVIPSMQTQHQTSDMPWAEARLGAERAQGAYAWRWLLDAGCMIANGSDAPVEALDVRAAWCAAVHRRTLAGEPLAGWHPAQRMTADEALRAMTIWPAYAAFREADLGRLAPGCRADFVVLDRALAGLAPAEIAAVRIEEVWFDGARVR
jgi:predicted amidohydrolase YtcJ